MNGLSLVLSDPFTLSSPSKTSSPGTASADVTTFEEVSEDAKLLAFVFLLPTLVLVLCEVTDSAMAVGTVREQLEGLGETSK